MKKLVGLLFIICVFSLAEAKISKKYKRPMLQVAPRMSLYINDFYADGTAFGLGGDIIINPLRSIGFRLGMSELRFNGGTAFTINSQSNNFIPRLDALIYIPMHGAQPFAHFGFGLSTSEYLTLVAVGGGMGVDYYAQKSFAFTVDPGIYILSASNGGSQTEVTFRLNAGIKFGIQ
jgi:hypothetical protein